jgi:hypothetical protein
VASSPPPTTWMHLKSCNIHNWYTNILNSPLSVSSSSPPSPPPPARSRSVTPVPVNL